MITREFASHLSDEWIASWNNRDLDRILSHYTDHIEMSSPHIA
jgi:ketosteroid isomerase-like protein